MLIPLRTDRPPKRRPVITEALIIVNLIVYLIGAAGYYLDLFEHGALAAFGHFDPQDFRAWQLVTYQFMHDPNGFGHIAFNMLFLWVFGAAVEDRLGRLGFIGFYLIAGIVAALAHSVAAGPDFAMPPVGRAMIETAKTRAMTGHGDAFVPEPADVWDLITRGNAEALGWPDAGRLEVGAAADLLVLKPPFEMDEHLIGRLIYTWRDEYITHRVLDGELVDNVEIDN